MVARLKAVSAVTDIVGSGTSARIRPLRRNQGGALPAVVYDQVGGYRANVTDGTSTTAESRFRVHCLADSYAGAHALSEAVEGALSGWNDSSSGVWHLTMGPQDGPDETLPGQDAAEFAMVQDYAVWHSTT
jgi:hypothetical protein